MRDALSALVVALTLVAGPAMAGIVDTPLPLLNGDKAIHIFTVPGATHTGTLGTVFFCASTEKTKPVTIGIEVFDFDGALLNDVTASNGILTLGPGNTFTFGTLFGGQAANFGIDETLTLSDGANHGTARILATSKNIVCSALLATLNTGPPTSMVSLSVVAKVKQKGD